MALGVSGAAPGPVTHLLLRLQPLPLSPPGTSGLFSPAPAEKSLSTVLKAMEARSLSSCFGLPPQGPVPLGLLLLSTEGRPQVLGHISPPCPQGGAGPSAQQKLCGGAMATLHGEMQGGLLEPASSIDLCTPVQEVASDLYVPSPGSMVQGGEAQLVLRIHLCSPGGQQLDGKQMSTSSSPVECRAAMPVLEAWVCPVLKQHLHVLEEKGAGARLLAVLTM